jgi:hypothetical protein
LLLLVGHNHSFQVQEHLQFQEDIRSCMDRILWSPTKGRTQTPADNIAVLTTFAVFAELKANQFKILVHTLAWIQKLTIKQAQCITLNRKQGSECGQNGGHNGGLWACIA